MMEPVFDNIETIRFILGDQLNHDHSWYLEKDEHTMYVVAEIFEEATYTRHHVQKVHAFFLAMEAFATTLKEAGHQVLYLTLDDTAGASSVSELLNVLADTYNPIRVGYQRPDEHRLLEQLRALALSGVEVIEYDTEHFMVPFADLSTHFARGKKHRMEQFYRRLRKQHNILMEDNEPVGGQWNYDATNRSKLKKSDLADIPAPLLFASDVDEVQRRLERHDIKTVGKISQQLPMPITRDQSLELLRSFCRTELPRFGDFQDAMTGNSDYAWSLYHSRLSFSMNVKLLHPAEVIDAAIAAYFAQDNIDISQVEGFVRQILGWREFVRGIYWANMPGYDELNALAAEKDLPAYFWTGDTQMNCVSKAITQSLDHAYAHHIQRLMVTGMFGLLAGVDPDQMDQWYLGIYIDAIEWVEMPNTRGMSQFADDGLITSKPYSASGNYINKMSDYCASCHYKVKEKTTKDACPFNSLYWHFMVRHREKFQNNPRIGMVYRNWDKQEKAVQELTIARGEDCLKNLEAL